MSEQQDNLELTSPDAHAPEDSKPLPLLVCDGKGYITRKDGTVVPFTFHGEM